MDVLRNRDLLVQAVMDDGYFHASERMDTMVRLRDQPVSLALLHATQLHIDPMGTNKATGLVGMCHELGVSFDDVMAIGDSPGDETYLRMAGCSIAMGNAVRHVQDWCDLVVASNDDDGVADAIERYFLASEPVGPAVGVSDASANVLPLLALGACAVVAGSFARYRKSRDSEDA